VSKLDIILEAIKYIDDLQDQLINRLSDSHLDRESTLLAIAATTNPDEMIQCLKMQNDTELYTLKDTYQEMVSCKINIFK